MCFHSWFLFCFVLLTCFEREGSWATHSSPSDVGRNSTEFGQRAGTRLALKCIKGLKANGWRWYRIHSFPFSNLLDGLYLAGETGLPCRNFPQTVHQEDPEKWTIIKLEGCCNKYCIRAGHA